MINAIKRLFAKKPESRLPESRLPEIKISLSDLDFQKLVSGIIVHRGLNTTTTVRICLQDIGFTRMQTALDNASGFTSTGSLSGSVGNPTQAVRRVLASSTMRVRGTVISPEDHLMITKDLEELQRSINTAVRSSESLSKRR